MYTFLNFKRANIFQTIFLFGFLFSLHILLREMRSSIITDGHFYDFYRSMFSQERVQDLIASRESNGWIFFIFKPLEILLSSILLFIVFATGFFFLEKRILYMKIYNIILITQSVFYLP